ncbi:MAG TPA: hypothetical protein VNM40_01855 [Candidatus Paceibacterota bacterium]|nr:hypothetical protein [Candidatus Paceibacterota bacterium]
METGIKSSFIPQAPVVGPSARRRGGSFDFLILIALVLFVASATLAVGVFLYVQFLQSSNASKLQQLERAKAAFEPALIQELTRLDDRMRAADEVLAQHIAPSALLKLFEQLTLQTVSFSSFAFTTNNGTISISMKGLAQSVNSIALQADLLSRSGVIVNPIFSDINRQIGGVRFNFSADVRREALLFRSLVQAPAPQTAPQNPLEQLPPSPFGGQPVEEGAPATSTPQSGDPQAQQQ